MPGRPCLSRDELLSLLQVDAGRSEDTELLSHLESCEQCRERLEEMAGRVPEGCSKQDIRQAYQYYRSGQLKSSTDHGGNHDSGNSASVREFLKTIGVSDVGEEDNDPNASSTNFGRMGKYELQELLGRGGMGMVFKGRDTLLNRSVAIKIIEPSVHADQTARQRFLQEARLAASIDHPNVVKIHSVESIGDAQALVMELVDGQSAADEFAGGSAIPESRILHLARQAAAGLAAAHDQRIVHRDVKPGNLLIEQGTDHLKIADFGLAHAAEATDLTRDGVVVGTPSYMSPEQILGQPLDARSDLFSLGSVLYQWCTGRPPFVAPAVMSVAYQVAHRPHAPVRRLNPEISVELAAVVDRLLGKSPNDRFQDAGELIETLDRIQPNRTRSRRPVRMTAIIVAVALLVGALWLAANNITGWWSNEAMGYRVRIAGHSPGYSSLAEAIQAAQPGDEIILAGSDPFQLIGQEIDVRPLTIRGEGDGRPIIMLGGLSQNAASELVVSGRLILENLEIKASITSERRGQSRRAAALVVAERGELELHRCRLSVAGLMCGVFMKGGHAALSDSSILAHQGIGIASESKGVNRVELDNSVLIGQNAIVWSFESREELGDDRLLLKHSTVRADVFFKLQHDSRSGAPQRGPATLTLSTEATVFDASTLLEVNSSARGRPGRRRASFSRAIRELVGWSGNRNLYGEPIRFFASNAQLDTEPKTVEEWASFWKPHENSPVQQELEFVGSRTSDLEGDHVVKGIDLVELNAGKVGFHPAGRKK